MRKQTPRDPRSALTDVPGIGDKLAGRILRDLDPGTVRDLSKAIDAGRLESVDGIGPKRESALREYFQRNPSPDGDGADSRLRSRLRCPVCHGESLTFDGQRPRCSHCGAQFDSLRGIPDFVGERDRSVSLAQTLMESSLYARWYEFFRPTLTRLISPRSLREEYALSTRLLDLESGAELLDVGCGNGNFTREFARHLRALDPDHNGFLLGLDLSRSMLLEAIQAEPKDSNLRYLRGDATSMPLRDNTFDRLHCAGSLHLMNDVKRTLSNFARVLRPGGLLVVGTFLLGEGLVRPLAKRIGGWLSRFHWFTRKELEQLLNETGFTLQQSSVAGDAITLQARRN